MGYYMDYRRAKIPKEQLGRFGFPDCAEDCQEYCWPKKAYNGENYFGYTFDSGMHSLCEYSFLVL
jgi:hypothetical protein